MAIAAKLIRPPLSSKCTTVLGQSANVSDFAPHAEQVKQIYNQKPQSKILFILWPFYIWYADKTFPHLHWFERVPSGRKNI